MRRLRQIVRFVRIALKARDIQDFLWGGRPGDSCRPAETLEGYAFAIGERVTKLNQLDRTKRSWKVEARKRLLQTATIAVAAMELIDGGCE